MEKRRKLHSSYLLTFFDFIYLILRGTSPKSSPRPDFWDSAKGCKRLFKCENEIYLWYKIYMNKRCLNSKRGLSYFGAFREDLERGARGHGGIIAKRLNSTFKTICLEILLRCTWRGISHFRLYQIFKRRALLVNKRTFTTVSCSPKRQNENDEWKKVLKQLVLLSKFGFLFLNDESHNLTKQNPPVKLQSSPKTLSQNEKR